MARISFLSTDVLQASHLRSICMTHTALQLTQPAALQGDATGAAVELSVDALVDFKMAAYSCFVLGCRLRSVPRLQWAGAHWPATRHTLQQHVTTTLRAVPLPSAFLRSTRQLAPCLALLALQSLLQQVQLAELAWSSSLTSLRVGLLQARFEAAIAQLVSRRADCLHRCPELLSCASGCSAWISCRLTCGICRVAPLMPRPRPSGSA